MSVEVVNLSEYPKDSYYWIINWFGFKVYKESINVRKLVKGNRIIFISGTGLKKSELISILSNNLR